MQFLLNLLERLRRKRIILDREGKDTYIERYYLLFPQNSHPQWFGFNLLLHHICQSDPEGLHDHPWGWGSLILKGGYWEETPEGRFWRKRGSLRFRGATALHRLEIDRDRANGETWTLFFIGHRHREWGFLTESGQWVQWSKHLEGRSSRVAEKVNGEGDRA